MKKKHDSEIVEYAKSIRKKLKESPPERELIDSPETLAAFLKKEKLYKAKISDQVRIIEKLAKDMVDGKRDIKIDLDKIPTYTTPGKLEASQMFVSLERELRQIQNPTYSETYQIIGKLVLFLQTLAIIGSLLFMGKTDTKGISKKKEFVKKVKQVGDPTKKTPNQLISWVKDLLSLIKK